MKTKQKLLIALVLIIIAGILGYNYIYQGHRDIQLEVPAFTLKATDFIKDFQNNEAAATEKYLNKTIEIEGILTSIDGNTVVIGDVVFFALSENEKTPNANMLQKKIQVKARCIGYDNLLGEVKLDQAAIRD